MINLKERKAYTLGYEALLKTFKIDMNPAIYRKFMDEFDSHVKNRGSKDAVAFYKQIKLYIDSIIRNDTICIETTSWVGTISGIPKKFKVLVELLQSRKLSIKQKQVISSLFDYPSLFIGRCEEYDTTSITDPEFRSHYDFKLLKDELSAQSLNLNKTLWGSNRDLSYVKSVSPPVRITNKSCYNGKLPLKGNGLKDIAAFMSKTMKMVDSSGSEVSTRSLAIEIAKMVFDSTEKSVEYPYIIRGNKYVKKVSAYKAFLYLCSTSIVRYKEEGIQDPHAYRTVFIAEQFGKERCAVVPNYTINLLMEPLDRHYMSWLRILKEDGTFNQNEAFEFVCSTSAQKGFNGSVDQSSWTDKLDLDLLTESDQGMIPRELSEKVNQIMRLPVKKTDKQGSEQSIYYARGAGMGTYFVWSRSSNFHHKMGQLCSMKAKLNGDHSKILNQSKPPKKFRDYRIVGDDITILNKEVLLIYLKTCKSIGLKVSKNKTIVTEGKNTSGVFCKRSYLKGKEVSSVTARMIANATLSLNNFVDLLRMLNQRKMLDELSDYELSDGFKNLVKPKWLGYLQSPYNEFEKPFIKSHPKGNLWEKVDENNFHIYYRYQIYKEIVSTIEGMSLIYKEWGLGGLEIYQYPEGRPQGEMIIDKERVENPIVENYPLLLFAYQQFIEEFILEFEEATRDYGLHTPLHIAESVLGRIHGKYHSDRCDYHGNNYAEYELDTLAKLPNPLKYGDKNPYKVGEICRQNVLLKALKGYLEDPSLEKQTAEDETGALELYSLYCSNYLDFLDESRPKWPYDSQGEVDGSPHVVTTPKE